MKDAEVVVLQKRLKAVGLYKGEIDGDFGPVTLHASLDGLKDLPVVAETSGKLDSSVFFDHVGEHFESLKQSQIEGFNQIIGSWNSTSLEDLRWLAYMLATAWHETAFTMKPITEYGSEKYLKAKKYWPYIGRGYVQLTWKENYEKYGVADKPEKALDPATAAFIMIDGMTKGIFTGKKLSDYFNASVDDPIEARRIINGNDKAKQIAGYHRVFLGALTSKA